jgi:hypothetical protein
MKLQPLSWELRTKKGPLESAPKMALVTPKGHKRGRNPAVQQVTCRAVICYRYSDAPSAWTGGCCRAICNLLGPIMPGIVAQGAGVNGAGKPDVSLRGISQTCRRVRANGPIRPRAAGQDYLEADVGEMASVRRIVRKRNQGRSWQADKASLQHHRNRSSLIGPANAKAQRPSPMQCFASQAAGAWRHVK